MERLEDDLNKEKWEQLDICAMYAGATGELVKRRFLNYLVDLPSRQFHRGACCEWIGPSFHEDLLRKAAQCQDLLLALLKMVPRDKAIAFLQGHSGVIKLVPHLKNDSTLLIACLNGLEEESAIGADLKDVVEVQILKDVIKRGTLKIGILKSLIVLHSEALIGYVLQLWLQHGDADAGVQLYQGICLLAALGSIAHVDGGIVSGLFSGIQRRLGSDEQVARTVAGVTAEQLSLLLPREDKMTGTLCVLDMKIDYEGDAAAGALLAAFRHGQYMSDQISMRNGHPYVRNVVASRNGSKKKKTSETEPETPVSQEPMAKSDKARIKPFVAEALHALSQHEQPARRAQAVNTLLSVPMSSIELQDMSLQLASSVCMLSDLYHLEDADNKILALRIRTALRLPEPMADQCIAILFGRNLGLFHKTSVLEAMVRSCQYAHRRIDISASVSRYLCDSDEPGDLAIAKRRIAERFIQGALDKATNRFKYLSDHDGLLGQHLFMAIATMLPCAHQDEQGMVLRLSHLVHGLVCARPCCPKGLIKGGIILSMACIGRIEGLEVGLQQMTAFMNNCIELCERYLRFDGSEEIRMLAGNLGGMLKEQFTLERILGAAAVVDDGSIATPPTNHIIVP